jgi:hypothetical protein
MGRVADGTRPDLAELDWSPEAAPRSLSAVRDHARGLAIEAEAWYSGRRGRKRWWGRALRVGAIVLGSVAAVLPVLSEIYTTDGKPAIAPGWATVFLAAAAALVALDRYFGFSSGWMRFMAAELRLTRLRHEFEYGWQAERAASGERPSAEHVAALLARAQAFVLAVDDVVQDETSGWISEFRTSLESAEQGLERSRGPHA